MTCRDFADFLGDYLANELADETRTAFERHLTRCENCQKYLTMYRQTVRLGREAFDSNDEGVPSQVPTELIDAIMAARRKSPRSS